MSTNAQSPGPSQSPKSQTPQPPPAPVAYEKVLEEEKAEIGAARLARDEALKGTPNERLIQALHEQYVGLAFSGGGIRSATFNLGVLQGLAELGLLPIIDYISTVSGGGYIGTWLTAWIRRKNFPTVVEALKTARPSGAGDRGPERHKEQEPVQIHRLREYSNYLTPKLGIVSGDTWAFIGSYVRNLVLNQLILGLVAIALLLVPRPIDCLFTGIGFSDHKKWAAVVAAILLTFAIGTSLANLSKQALTVRDEKDVESALASGFWIFFFVTCPTLISLWLFWAWAVAACPGWNIQGIPWGAGFIAAFCFTAMWLVGWFGGDLVRGWLSRDNYLGRRGGALTDSSDTKNDPHQPKRNRAWRVIVWAFPAGLVGGLLIAKLAEFFSKAVDSGSPRDDIYGFPCMVLVFLFIQTLHVGLCGSEFSEDAREWWGRLSGALMLYTLYVTILFAIALDSPNLFPWLFDNHMDWVKWALTALWAAITGSGLIVGKSTSKPTEAPGLGRTIIAKAAPFVFIVGLFVLLAWFTNTYFGTLGGGEENSPGKFQSYVDKATLHAPRAVQAFVTDLSAVGSWCARCYWFYIVLFLGLAWMLSVREGINRFSMHSLYRNRLVRCYLGASNPDRKPQPFIGLDPQDDAVKFTDLLSLKVPESAIFVEDSSNSGRPPDETCGRGPYQGPYPIYNAALNLVSGKDLAWQQRKAASFVFTPKYSGYEFADTQTEGQDSSKPRLINALQETRPLAKKLKLGLAMAISGAAASPNMGSHSTPALAFLMTVFNVRLGWWLANPYMPEIWARAKMGPGNGLLYLFNELLGHTDFNSNYVYLSDGGHFENLALYELVRRRCRFIIVCDAGEDHQFHFDDLGNAIEKCRTDFGIDIEIDIEQIRPPANSTASQWHCAVGTIHYEKVDDGTSAGTLLYIKSSLTGDEPTDVKSYGAQHAEFPHETTADQWFTESQFESYRALGHHIVQSAIGVVGDDKEIAQLGVEGLFVKLRQHWYPPSRYIAQSFTKHTATYAHLLETMRTDKNLAFLSAQVYPEWPNLMGEPTHTNSKGMWLPPSAEHRRAGFYFCNEVIQLMEDAYIDLNLEADYDHPDNRGWMNLFRHWSWSGMFVATWAISAGIYGARFQSFCERRLDLTAGVLGLLPMKKVYSTGDALDKEIDPNLDAQKRWDVDFFEAQIISKFARQWLAETPIDDIVLKSAQLYVQPIQVTVKNPRQDDPQHLDFNVGFALLQCDDDKGANPRIVYFRIQDHLRKMGLGRKALGCLFDEKHHPKLGNEVKALRVPDGESDKTRETDATQTKDSAGRNNEVPKRPGASVLEAYPSREAELRFKNLFYSAQIRESQKKGSGGTKPGAEQA